MKSIPISETFGSIQGEGAFAGVPSYFIRVSGCNLRCVWCDTPYASWNPEGSPHEIDHILHLVDESGIQHVVLTGGEPALFDATLPLVAELQSRGRHVTIETAGTIDRHYPGAFLSISPKLSHSAPPRDTPNNWRERHNSTRLNFDVLASLTVRHEYQLKFVVASIERDLAEIQTVVNQIENVRGAPLLREHIYLMPEGRDSVQIWERLRALVPICMERGFRLAPRLQIDLFGDTRGT